MSAPIVSTHFNAIQSEELYTMVAEFYKHLYRPSGLLINRYCVFVIRGITGIDT